MFFNISFWFFAYLQLSIGEKTFLYDLIYIDNRRLSCAKIELRIGVSKAVGLSPARDNTFRANWRDMAMMASFYYEYVY